MRKLFSLFLVSGLLLAQLQVSSRSLPVNDYETALAVGSGQTSTATSANASNTRLMGVDVWSSVPYKALIYTVSNGVQSSSPSAVGGAPGFSSFQWRTPDPAFIVLGSSGGQDAYRVVVTNLDQTNTADFYVSFHYGM